MHECIKASWLKYFCSQNERVNVIQWIRLYLWEEKENLGILHPHLFSPSALKSISSPRWGCWQRYITSTELYMGVESCARYLTQGLPPGVKPGASCMPSACTFGQNPLPDLASVPVDLVGVPCCRTAQILSKPNASVSQRTFKLMVK